MGGYRGTQPGGTFDHDYNWADFAYHAKVPTDSDGHGSNVAGIATGSQKSGVGVAPGAQWISAKVYNYAGYSAHSWTIAGVQWTVVSDRRECIGRGSTIARGALGICHRISF